jgi:hypothetical protein
MAEGEQRQLLKGFVERDETRIGGKPRNGGGGTTPKRGRGPRRFPLLGWPSVAVVRMLITDEYSGYFGISRFMPKQTVNHQGLVCRRRLIPIHQSFWALLRDNGVVMYSAQLVEN